MAVESVTGEVENGSKLYVGARFQPVSGISLMFRLLGRSTVRLRLGKDHLPEDHTLDKVLFSARHGTYVRDFVEEARMWSSESSYPEGNTPSADSDNTTASDTSMSTAPSKFDISALSFSKLDIVLIGEDIDFGSRIAMSISLVYLIC